MNSELNAIRQPQDLRIRNPKDEQNLIAKADLSLPTKNGGWQYGFQLTTLSNNNSLIQQNQLPTGAYKVDLSFTNQGKYKERSYAGYAGFNTKLKSGWALQTGLRYEWTHQELLTSDLKKDILRTFPQPKSEQVL